MLQNQESSHGGSAGAQIPFTTHCQASVFCCSCGKVCKTLSCGCCPFKGLTMARAFAGWPVTSVMWQSLQDSLRRTSATGAFIRILSFRCDGQCEWYVSKWKETFRRRHPVPCTRSFVYTCHAMSPARKSGRKQSSHNERGKCKRSTPQNGMTGHAPLTHLRMNCALSLDLCWIIDAQDWAIALAIMHGSLEVAPQLRIRPYRRKLPNDIVELVYASCLRCMFGLIQLVLSPNICICWKVRCLEHVCLKQLAEVPEELTL